MKTELEYVNRNNKKNGIVIYGIKTNNEVSAGFICEKIRSLLQVEVSPSEINDFYVLGKGEANPIKVQLVQFWKKREILKNAHKLKETNVYISHDLTKLQIEESKILRNHLKLAKIDNQANCYIRKHELFVNGREYTVDDLKNIETQSTEDNKLVNSAPETPNTNFNINNTFKPGIANRQTVEEVVNANTPIASKTQRNIETAQEPKTGPITRRQDKLVRKNSTSQK